MISVFTGLIEEIGTVKRSTVSNAGSGFLVVQAAKILDGLRIGDSISISGACQTVIDKDATTLTVEVMPETTRRTTLGTFRTGDQVNLERAIAAGDRFGGHIVNGHVDCVGTVLRRAVEGNAVILTIGYDADFSRYVAFKGSVAVDGVSLTVASAAENEFSVSLVQHTLSNTTLKEARAGTRVNIEFDIIAKYVEALLNGARLTEMKEKNLIDKLMSLEEDSHAEGL